MKVSVITINYNDRAGLARTMASVMGQTATSADFEYIVIDGGSTDGSAEVIWKYAARLAHHVSEPDGGIYAAMNKGIAAARGEYGLFMNAGDTFHAPDVLEKAIPLLAGADFYCGDTQQTGHRRHRLIPAPRFVTAQLLANKFLMHQSTFIRTALLKARPYRTDFRINADWEQMFHEMVMHSATYAPLPLIVADFDTGGISCNPAFDAVREAEHDRGLSDHLPPRVVEALVGRTPFDHKLCLALDKAPLARDLKILRNVLKVLPRDLWHALVRRKTW